MKANNLMIVLFTLLLGCFSSLLQADDGTLQPASSEVTVNINQDSAELLAENLAGIGLSRAKAIVEYRDKYGPFFSAEELSAVRGIGMATIEKNSSRIVVE